jgi:group II intron reverse transcriptase/maturase
MVINTLAHHIDLDLLREAYRRTRKDGAVGVDGQTAQDYEAQLESNLSSLLTRFKTGSYRAPPVRRVHIPKGDGSKTRPIGIPTFEDKVLQRAVQMVLEPVYEQDFHDFSYGFRPARSAHQALKALRDGLMAMRGGWVIEVDIRGFFDTLDHTILRGFLDQRVRDGVLRRTIDKWLNAGVLEDGCLTRPELGSPQGGVISPLLANIYLHEVMDKWFDDVVKRRVGKCFAVRYADDIALVFYAERDARRVLAALPKHFGKFGLTLHPDKTRLIRFVRPRFDAQRSTAAAPQPEPGTFEMLGFLHYWGRSRRGYWVIRQQTSPSRFRRALKRVGEWCRLHRHRPIDEQHATLAAKLRGHYEYYGLTGNSRALARFRSEVCQLWRKWLLRRSQRTTMTWANFVRVLERFPLPSAVCVHSILRRAARP